MILIAGSSNVKLASEVAIKAGFELVTANVQQFADQELKISMEGNLEGKEVAILQSTSRPANDNIMELLFLIDIAKETRAKKITLIIPYFGYSRQDKLSSSGTIAARLVAKLIEDAGINRIITLDLHSKEMESFFNIEVQNLGVAKLFAEKFEKNQNLVVISPDLGGKNRARDLAKLLGADLAIFTKTRNQNGECEMIELNGDVEGKDCLIIDDIIDTGGTLLKAAKILVHHKGAKSVSACITHGIFSRDISSELEIFKEFYVTDTIDNDKLPKEVKLVSVSDLIVEALS